jgi:hypothetical protein
MSRSMRCLMGLVGLACLATGCTKKMPIYSIPPWYSEDIKSVAVQEFKNPTGNPAASALSAQLATSLMANRTYRVLNRADLRSLMDERDLQAAMGEGTDPAASAAAMRKIGKVDAILTGTVTGYRVDTDRQRITKPNMVYDPQAKKMVQRGYNSFMRVEHNAVVEVSASLIRVSDGQPLGATQGAVVGQDKSVGDEGAAPPRSAGQTLAFARNDAVSKLVETFAIVQTEIKIKPDDVLKISTGRPAGEWIKKDKFAITDTVMFIVIDLPQVCDRNRFRFEIAKGKDQPALMSQKIQWTQSDCGMGGKPFKYSPAEIAEKGGLGDYVVRFYSGLKPEPIFDKKFKIEQKSQ